MFIAEDKAVHDIIDSFLAKETGTNYMPQCLRFLFGRNFGGEKVLEVWGESLQPHRRYRTLTTQANSYRLIQ